MLSQWNSKCISLVIKFLPDLGPLSEPSNQNVDSSPAPSSPPLNFTWPSHLPSWLALSACLPTDFSAMPVSMPQAVGMNIFPCSSPAVRHEPLPLRVMYISWHRTYAKVFCHRLLVFGIHIWEVHERSQLAEHLSSIRSSLVDSWGNVCLFLSAIKTSAPDKTILERHPANIAVNSVIMIGSRLLWWFHCHCQQCHKEVIQWCLSMASNILWRRESHHDYQNCCTNMRQR